LISSTKKKEKKRKREEMKREEKTKMERKISCYGNFIVIA
jgi:hypothetical protein